MTIKKNVRRGGAESAGSSGRRALSFLVGLTVIILIILLAIPSPKNANGFATIAEVERYAAQFDEFKVEMSGENLVKPDYAKHYASLKFSYLQSRLQAFKSFFHLMPRPAWTAETFSALAQQLLDLSLHRDWKGLFIHKIVPTAGGKIVVWGDISGAFHSLVRDLGELVKQGILTADLKVAKDNYYLVFLGDVVSRSPFLMETTSLVMRLRLNNPDNVFHLRGNHESNDYWQGFGLKEELEMRAAHLKTDKTDEIPLRPLVRQYFDTLPTAIYVGMPPEVNKDFVRLSHEGGAEFEIITLNEKLTDDAFLAKPLTDKVGTFKIQNLPDDNTLTINLKAIIRAEVKRKSYQQNDGLRLIEPEGGVTSWTLLSCPTEVYRKGLQYFYDAFAILDVGPTPQDWTITLNNHDVRSRDITFAKRTHNLISGQGAAPQDQGPAPLDPKTRQSDKVSQVPQGSAPSQVVQQPVQTPQPAPVSHIVDQPLVPAPEPQRSFKPVAQEVEEEITFEPAPVPAQPVPSAYTQPEPEPLAPDQTFDIALQCRVEEQEGKRAVTCEVVNEPEDRRDHLALKRRVIRPQRPERHPAFAPKSRESANEQTKVPSFEGSRRRNKGFNRLPAYPYSRDGGRSKRGTPGDEAEYSVQTTGFGRIAQ